MVLLGGYPTILKIDTDQFSLFARKWVCIWWCIFKIIDNGMLNCLRFCRPKFHLYGWSRTACQRRVTNAEISDKHPEVIAVFCKMKMAFEIHTFIQ